MNATELVGYLASALVVVSLAMTSVVRLRAVSLAGSVAFIAYGVAIESPPIVVTNVAVAALNIWFLRLELGGHRQLGASPIAPDAPFLADFLRYHLADIHRFQPDFEPPAVSDDVIAMVLMRDGLPAGAFIGLRDGRDLEVSLDYVIKQYRDSQISQWLYGKGSAVFRRLGVDRIVSRPGAELHSSYLARSGFVRQGDCYVLELA